MRLASSFYIFSSTVISDQSLIFCSFQAEIWRTDLSAETDKNVLPSISNLSVQHFLLSSNIFWSDLNFAVRPSISLSSKEHSDPMALNAENYSLSMA